MAITLKIITQTNSVEVEVDIDCFVSQLKETIALQCGIPIEEQQLIYMGSFMENTKRISDYTIQDGHAVHLVQRRPRDPTIDSAPALSPLELDALTYLALTYPELFPDEGD